MPTSDAINAAVCPFLPGAVRMHRPRANRTWTGCWWKPWKWQRIWLVEYRFTLEV